MKSVPISVCLWLFFVFVGASSRSKSEKVNEQESSELILDEELETDLESTASWCASRVNYPQLTARGLADGRVHWTHPIPVPPFTLHTAFSPVDVVWRSRVRGRFSRSKHLFKSVTYVPMDRWTTSRREWRQLCEHTPPTPGCADIIFTYHISACLAVGLFYLPQDGDKPRFLLFHYLANGLSEFMKLNNFELPSPTGRIEDSAVQSNRKLLEELFAGDLNLKSVSLSDFFVVVASGAEEISYSFEDNTSSYAGAAVSDLLAMGFTCEQIALNPRSSTSSSASGSAVSFAVRWTGHSFEYGRVLSESSDQMIARRKAENAVLLQHNKVKEKTVLNVLKDTHTF
eukprot:gnl/Spiro4/24440_TR12114_c1_g3_i1.p1 gnl/Spiro4/24440_TR12114_c1_g3~~gnl/Spiro4/24440_TR12114_c1_g3_i1.p1  ORF type:complete len:350 (-),score=59.76 gnl/Spiro4/24440_TR12114_c1_g3_i1:198-1226(-)